VHDDAPPVPKATNVRSSREKMGETAPQDPSTRLTVAVRATLDPRTNVPLGRA
jgi:hypothetical protein